MHYQPNRCAPLPVPFDAPSLGDLTKVGPLPWRSRNADERPPGAVQPLPYAEAGISSLMARATSGTTSSVAAESACFPPRGSPHLPGTNEIKTPMCRLGRYIGG